MSYKKKFILTKISRKVYYFTKKTKQYAQTEV